MHHVAVTESTNLARSPRSVDTTLLDLVRAVSAVTEDDREVVATIVEMLRNGRVRLTGSFRDAPVDEF